MSTFHEACSILVCPNWCKTPHGQIITPCSEIFSTQVSVKRPSWAEDKEDNNNLFQKFSVQANIKPLLWAENLTDSRRISAQERHNEQRWADSKLPALPFALRCASCSYCAPPGKFRFVSQYKTLIFSSFHFFLPTFRFFT